MTASPLSSPIRSVQLEDHSLSLFISSSSQLRSLLSSTMENYTSLFSPEDTTQLPVFKLQLCLDEDAIQFFPTLEDLEAAVMFPLNSLASDILQSFPLIQVCTVCIGEWGSSMCVPSMDWMLRRDVLGCSIHGLDDQLSDFHRRGWKEPVPVHLWQSMLIGRSLLAVGAWSRKPYRETYKAP